MARNIFGPGVFFLMLALMWPVKAVSGEGKTADMFSKPWARPIPNQKVPRGLRSIRASECGECHEAIYEEWKKSTHAVALQDPQFQAEWKKDGLYLCANCHIPLQNQQPKRVLGLKDNDFFKPITEDNPDFDPKLREESITCAVCHVRDGAVIGAKGIGDAPHETKIDTEFLGRKLCFGCHNVSDVITPTLVCSFQTGDEWLAGPYPQKDTDCIDCHMPAVKRPISSGGNQRNSHRHTWTGGGIGKFPGEYLLEKHYKSGLSVKVRFDEERTQPLATVSIQNAYAGHKLPTGDPERFILVEFGLVDSRGDWIDKKRKRIGQTWRWHPKAEKLGDNRMAPLETRTFQYRSSASPVPPKSSFRVLVTHHRITKENAAYMGLLGKYPLSRIVFDKQWPFTFD